MASDPEHCRFATGTLRRVLSPWLTRTTDRQRAVSECCIRRDDCGVLQLEGSILEHAGLEVSRSNRAEGLKSAKNCNVDLAALDYEMPRMTAVEIAQRLQAMQPTIRVIVISGTELPEESGRVVDCFVPKTQMVRTLA